MASSVVWTLDRSRGHRDQPESKVYKIAWAAHTDGTVTSVAAPWDIFGYIVRVVTNPGSTAPTADYDITLTDDDGCDVLGAEGSNRSATLNQQIIPALGNSYGPCYVNGGLTFNLSNNSVNAATGEVIIYVEA